MALPAGLGLTGVARGAAQDWTAAGAPFAALVLGPALAARINGGAAGSVVGWAMAGGLPLLLTWLLARNP